MSNDPVAGAKAALHNADNFGQRETGNKKAGDPTPPHKDSSAPISYQSTKAEPSVADELKAKSDNVTQYAASQK